MTKNNKYLKNKNIGLMFKVLKTISKERLVEILDSIKLYDKEVQQYLKYKNRVEYFKTKLNIEMLYIRKIDVKKYSSLFNFLDSMNVEITDFIKYIVNINFKNKLVEIESKCKKVKIIKNNNVEFKKNEVSIDNIKGKEEKTLEFYKEFLIINKPDIIKCKDIILDEKSKFEIVKNTIKIYNDTINKLIKDKTNKLECNGCTIITIHELYRDRDYLSRYLENKIYISSIVLQNVRFKLKEILYINENEDFIDDFERFNILINYFDICILKNNVVLDELTKIGYRFDKGSKYYQACFIEKVFNKKVYKFEKNNSYISTDKDKMNEMILLQILYPIGIRHRSSYIEIKKCRYKLMNKETKQIKEIKEVKKADLDKYIRLYNNDVVYNCYSDTEDEWIFYLCQDYKVPYESKQIDRDTFLKYMNENIDYLRTFTQEEIRQMTHSNDYDNSNLLKHKIFAKSKLIMIQLYLEDEITKDHTKIMIIDEEKKEDFNTNYLKYTYKQKINNEEINKTIVSEVIYTKNIVNYYLSYIINWFRGKHSSKSNRFMRMNVFFHNLKFDILTIGLIDLFEKYNFTIENMNVSLPTFFDFNCNFQIKNRSGKEIKSKLLFLDSMNFVATSLKNLGKNVGIDKEVEKVDFYWNDRLIINRKFLEYSIMDVVILREFMYQLKQEIQKDTTFKSYGSAGTAISTYLTSKYGKEVDKNRKVKKLSFKYIDLKGNEITKEDYKKLNIEEKKKIKKEKQFILVDKLIKIHKHKNRILEQIALNSYFGGRTQCWNKLGYYERILSVDINSSYPSSMYNKLPYEYYQSYLNLSMKDTLQILNSDNFYSIALIYIPYDNNELIPIKRDNKVCFDNVVNYTTLLHEPELKELLKINKDIRILELHTYYATDKLFKQFVDEGMFNKSYYKLIEKNDIKVTYYKLTRNSCYGKFGEKQRISNTKQMDEYEIEFFRLMLSIKYQKEFTVSELKKYVGYVDISLNASDFIFKWELSKFDFGFNPYTYKNIYKNLKSYFDENENRIRINLIRDNFSYMKKIERPSMNGYPELAGAITSYSRVALYKAIKILGKERVLYGDTDSLYFKLLKNESVEDIKELFFNEIELKNKDELKFKFESMDTYKEYLKEVEKKCVVDKINTSSGIVSKKHLWEIENKEDYSILVRGNKDNIKMKWIDIEDIYIIKNVTDYIKFLNDENYDTCIKDDVLKQIKKNRSLYKNKKVKIKFNEKMKGVSKNAQQIDHNLYLNMQWLSLKTNSNMFQNYSNQYVVPIVKSLEGRDEYQKARVVKKIKRKIKFCSLADLKDDFKNSFGKHEIVNIKEVEFTEQIIKPYTITNINLENKYFDSRAIEIVPDNQTFNEWIENKEKLRKVQNVINMSNKEKNKKDNINRKMTKEEYKKMMREKRKMIK